MNILEDIRYLEANGEWPNKTVPTWAAKKAKELHCNGGSAAVIKWGLMQTIDELEEKIKKLETPATNPVHVVKEVSQSVKEVAKQTGTGFVKFGTFLRTKFMSDPPTSEEKPADAQVEPQSTEIHESI